MAETGSGRKLASIVAIDVAGYSRRSETDEAAAIEAVAALHERVIKVAAVHGGRVFNTAGDGFMLEFPTASGALAAAEEIAAASDPPVRAGVHLGEVSVTSSGDLLGHGVNVAARIQQMASPGAVLASGDVKRAIRGPLAERLRPQGSVRLDKMSETLPVFALAPADGGKAKGRRLDLKMPAVVGVGALVLALAGLSLWLAHGVWPSEGVVNPRVAILPFKTLTTTQDARDFADGLTDELQSVLSTDQMQVVSRTEADTLRGPNQDRRLKQLGVRLLFDGAVRSDGRALSVRVHIEDPRQHVTLWSADLSGAANQPAALQAQVGARAVAVLNCSAQALRPSGGLSDPSVLALYLRGCDLVESKGWGDDVQAIFGVQDAFRQVASRAPGFAPGHSALAKFIAYYMPAMPADQIPQLRAECDREARRALQIDPRDADAYVALSLLKSPFDYAGREQLLGKALAANPASPAASGLQGSLLMDVGRLNESVPLFQRAASANPLSLDWTTYTILAWTGRTDAADAELARLGQLWPRSAQLWYDGLLVFSLEHRWDRLLALLDNADARPKDFSPTDIERIRASVKGRQSSSPAGFAAARQGLIAAGSGDAPGHMTGAIPNLSDLGALDDAFAMADRYSRARNDGIGPFFLFSPANAAMRRDPRFMALAARLGLVDYWRSTGKWPDFCAEPGLPYDCKTEAAKLAGARHG